MAPSRSIASASWLSSLLLLLLACPSHALFFYLEGSAPKCFYEELPKDTLVVGHYKAEAYNPQTTTFGPTSDLTMLLTVEETFDDDHRVVSHTSVYNPATQSADFSNRFTFSAADSGVHRLCFHASGPAATSGSGWFSGGNGGIPGAVRLTLDLVIGETSKIESEDKGKMEDMTTKVRELNGRLTDIRREQVFQREREAEFRDQSETTNARVVRWTLIQLAVLGVTCAWQLSHLRAFFIKQKLT